MDYLTAPSRPQQDYVNQAKTTELRNPNLSEKCSQFDDRIQSVFSAINDLEGITSRLLGAEIKDGGSMNQGGQSAGTAPKAAPPVDLQFAASLERLASAEGWLRTLIARLDRGV